MKKDIDSNLKWLKNFLTESKRFIIPEYQRAYDWNVNEQVDRLWQDLESFVEESNEESTYFLGSVIMLGSTGDENSTLIDGQQRTTTFMLLLKALYLRIKAVADPAAGEQDERKLYRQLQDRQREILSALFVISEDDAYDVVDGATSLGELETKYVNNSINEPYKTEVNTILRGENAEIIRHDVQDIKYKRGDNRKKKYFRTFNYFVEKFDQLDTLKLNNFAKRILYQSQIITIVSYDMEEAIEIFNSLNSTGLPLSDADIFSAKMYGKTADGEERQKFMDTWQELVRTSNVDDLLLQYMYINRARLNQKSTTLPGLRRYFIDMEPRYLDNPQEFVSDLKTIAYNWSWDSMTIDQRYLVTLLGKFNSNFRLYLATYMFLKPKEDGAISVANYMRTLLKMFVLLEIVEVGYSSSNFKVFLYNQNMALGQGVMTSDIIKNYEKHIAEHFDRESIMTQLQNKSVNISLVTLNEYLFAQENSVEPVFLTFDKAPDVEHVVPASGNNLLDIRVQSGFESEEQAEEYKDLLGNKILLESGINRSLGNPALHEKRIGRSGEKDGYQNSQYPIAKYLGSLDKDVWTKKDIEQATTESAERIVDFIFSTVN